MKRRIVTAVGMCLACSISFCLPQTAAGAIRVVAYNTFNNPNGSAEDAWFATVFSAIAAESVNGIAKRPDLVAVSEKAMRPAEAANLGADADALGEGKHIIYAGDFNMLGSSEGAWANTPAGCGPANAPPGRRPGRIFPSIPAISVPFRCGTRYNPMVHAGLATLRWQARRYRVACKRSPHTSVRERRCPTHGRTCQGGSVETVRDQGLTHAEDVAEV